MFVPYLNFASQENIGGLLNFGSNPLLKEGMLANPEGNSVRTMPGVYRTAPCVVINRQFSGVCSEPSKESSTSELKFGVDRLLSKDSEKGRYSIVNMK